MVFVIVSIDTEEDNWERRRDDVTVQNIRALPRLAAFFDRLGIRPTYFTSYQVAIDPCGAEVMREVGDATRGEIAAHLHPWNTPPLDEAFVPRNSMLHNLPADLQVAKLQRLTATLEDTFDIRPSAFRAGRYGFGRETVPALVRCGYSVDSSVTPSVSWEAFDEGPSFVDAPLGPYRLAPGLVEIPLSWGFSRAPFRFWGALRRSLEAPPFSWLRLAGVAGRLGLVTRIALSPELSSAQEMLTLSRRLLEQGAVHLHLSWHSPTLTPGLSPFTATAGDVENLYATVEAFFDGLPKITPFTFSTVSEAAAALGEPARA